MRFYEMCKFKKQKLNYASKKQNLISHNAFLQMLDEYGKNVRNKKYQLPTYHYLKPSGNIL